MSDDLQRGGRPGGSGSSDGDARRWRLDGRYLGDAAMSLAGSAGAAGGRILFFVVLARSLDGSASDAFAAAHALGACCSRLATFQVAQGFTRIGMAARSAEAGRFRAEAWLAMRFDALGAVLQGALLAAAWPLVSPILRIDGLGGGAVVLLALAGLQMNVGFAQAALRIHGRFILLSALQIAAALSVLALALAAPDDWRNPRDLLAMYAISEAFWAAASYATACVAARRLLGERHAAGRLRADAGSPRAYWSGMGVAALRLAAKDLDVLLLGLILRGSDVGLFRLVKQLGSFPQLLVDGLYWAIYPRFARAAAAGERERFRADLRRVLRWAGWLSFAALAAVAPACALMAPLAPSGTGRGAFALALALYATGILIGCAVFPVTPALLALGRERRVLAALGTAAVAYLAAVAWLAAGWGSTAAAGAMILYMVAYSMIALPALRVEKVL